MKEKELKELKLTKNIIIPFPNFQQNTIISPTQMNDNFEEIEHAYNTLIDNHNGAITKVNKALAEITSSDNEALTNEQFRVQAENIRVQNEEERIANEEERKTEETKRIAMYNTHLNDEIRREQKHIQMVGEFDLKKTELDAFIGEKEEEVQNAINSIPTKEELKGEKGDKGDRGEKGEQGERGLQGIQGVQGLKGDKGDKGEQGERGLQGIQGLKGDKGDKGDKGEKGDKGDKGDPGQNTIIDYIYEEVNSPNPSVSNSIEGSLEDIQILGNTVQDPNNLADIKSVGELQEDGTYKMSILSCGKNLFDGNEFSPRAEINQYSYTNGILTMSCDSQPHRRIDYILPNTLVHGKRYILTANVKALEYSSNFTPGQYFGYGYYNNGSETYFGDFDTSSNIMTLNFIYKEQGDKSIGFHNDSKDGVTKLQWSNIQLEEGTVATEYEPYQENKCDILLPCQLEKVGDVSDRLYYDDVEKVWCIEKKNDTYYTTGDEENIRIYNNGTTNTIGFVFNFKTTNDRSIFVEGFSYQHDDSDKEHCLKTANELIIYLNRGRLTTQDVMGFKQWLKASKLKIVHQLATPQKIVLPLSAQIQLNSFFGTTHIYMESGEVEGTIKCKVPKSLGATVQSLNNKTDILSDRIEAIEGLKDSQNMKYETDKGYLVCKETKIGVIDDLKIEGKTLVNLVDNNSFTEVANYSSIVIDVTKFKPSTTYTLKLFGNLTTVKYIYMGSRDDTEIVIPRSTTTFIKFITPSNINSFTKEISLILYNNGTDFTSEICKTFKAVILEGDHTQNPPSCFEGLMSVGEDVDKIEVLSCNENLFDMDNFSIGTGSLYAYCKYPNTNGLTLSIEDRDTSVNTSEMYIGVTKIGVDASQGVYWCLANQTIENRVIQTDFSYVSFYPNNRETIETLNKRFKISVYVGKVNKPYTPHKSDKKQILFYNENGELEPIQELHEWDSIEKHSDNKWYYHKRSGKVVLNGSENWILHTTNYFKLSNPDMKVFDNTIKPNIISDRYITMSLNNSNTVDSSISNGNGDAYIYIYNKTISTVEELKQSLQTNNVTVVYQLAEEEVYELAPLHLDSYANETLILCNSGAISPKMEFSITSHINELIKSQGDRISLLEEKMYKALKQVLAGDMYSLAELLYPEDFVSKEKPIDVPTLLI